MFASRAGRLRRGLALVGACLAAQVLVGFLLTSVYLLFHNTLRTNGNWVSTKTTLGKPFIAAVAYTSGQQALARQRLNLGAWHGFQEVLYARPLDVRELEFCFLLEPGAYLAASFNRAGGRYSGVRFSTRADLPSVRFTASADGAFTRKEPLRSGAVTPDAWHHGLVRFDDNGFTVLLDGRNVGRFREAVAKPQTVGFRGGLHAATVDDVAIRPTRGEAVRESFCNRRDALRVTLVCEGLVLGMNALFFLLLLAARGRIDRATGFGVLLFNLVWIAAGLCAYGFQYATGRNYPVVDSGLLKAEARYKELSAQEVIRRIRREHPGEAEPGTHRVLVLGTSQTWGMGADQEDDTFPAVLEDLLNRAPGNAGTFVCINGGSCGVDSAHLAATYETEWAALNATTVVVNLSNNDHDPERFAANLARIVRTARTQGARPIFILEANSPEKDDALLRRRHRFMRRVGAKQNVAVLDMHAYLAARNDDGFLWWDWVHLSSFGQRLVAERAKEAILQGAAGTR